MLADLLARPEVSEEVVLRGPVGVMAIHGGVEAGTAGLARAAARAAGASLYVVSAPSGPRWHLSSVLFDPAESPALESFVSHVRWALSLHGFGRPGMEDAVLLGGRNRRLARALATRLRASTGLRVVDDLTLIPARLRGVDERNPVNLPTEAGVQVELCRRARRGRVVGRIVAAMAGLASVEMDRR